MEWNDRGRPYSVIDLLVSALSVPFARPSSSDGEPRELLGLEEFATVSP